MTGMGTIVNVLAVLAGGCIGMFLNKGLKKRFQIIMMQALGVCVLFIGIAGALKGLFVVNGSALETAGIMMMIISMVAGALIGEAIDIEKRIETFGEWLKMKSKDGSDSKFVQGFVSTTLVISIGAMAVVGSLQDGLTGDASMLYVKAILDLIVVMIFASAFGKGAIFSAIPLGLFQGSITAFAHFIEPILTQQMILNISLVGSILIFNVGVNMVFDKKLKTGNMLPALLIAAICSVIKF